MSPLLVLPNLGGEEGASWRRARDEPRVAAARALFGALFGRGALLLDGDARSAASPHGEPAFAWCEAPPEPALSGIAWFGDEAARDELERAGARFAGAPPSATRRVHDKAFALREGDAHWAGLAVCYDAQSLAEGAAREATLRSMQAAVDGWPSALRAHACLKPRFGTSARGRVHVRDARVDGPAVRQALDRLAARGGAVLEPWVERTLDLSVAFHVAAGAPLALLGSLQSISTPSGAPRGHRGEIDARGRIYAGGIHDEAMRGAAATLVAAAARAGYAGPCSVDGFAYLDASATPKVERLRSAVELNARFTLGIAAIGALRRASREIRGALRIAAEERAAFVVAASAPEGGWRPHFEATRARGAAAHLVEIEVCGAPDGDARAAIVAAREPESLDELCTSL